MITIYLIRHSQPFRQLLGEYNANEIEQIRNEKNPLSVDGEKYAEQMSNYSELLNIDFLYSSHYVRAMATAKYIAEKNIEVVDLGVAVISMHAPYEVIAKADLYMTYKGMCAFNR